MKYYNYRKSQGYLSKFHPMKIQRELPKKRLGSKQRIFLPEEAKTRSALVVRTCPGCHRDFATYRCLTKNTNNSYCSPYCYKKLGNAGLRLYRKTTGLTKKNAKKLLRDGFYASQKEKFADKLIPYKDSPSGMAYIGVAKQPLMKSPTGIGFLGVIVQDDTRQLVQCAECGIWKRKISDRHLRGCCGLSSREYKVKHGLNWTKGIVGDETSMKLAKNALKNKIGIRYASTHLKNIGLKKSSFNRTGLRHTLQTLNKNGTCPLQLKYRTFEFIKANRELPTSSNRGQPIYKALCNRFGSFGYALQSYGLPFLKRNGTNMSYTFPDGSTYKFNLNRWGDRMDLYAMMMEKCPSLTAPLQ